MTLPLPLDAPFQDRLVRALEDRGLPSRTVFAAVAEALGDASTAGLTDAEVEFAASAGVPREVLSGDGAHLMMHSALLTALDSGQRGPRLTTNEVAERLGRAPSNVRRMLGAGDLYAAGRVNRQTAYPAWQFASSGVLPHLRQVVAAFPQGFHARDIEAVMTSPMEELNGRTPHEWLENDGSVDTLLDLLSELSLS